MAKFIFIDQSLRSVEGHHYDYAINLLGAIQAGGYAPILATHRKLQARACFPPAWQVIPCFHHSTFSRHSLYGSQGKVPRSFSMKPETCFASEVTGEAVLENSQSLWSRLWAVWNEQSRRSQLKRFAQACDQLFSAVKLEEGDHVFFATISEFDFLGLADFFERFPQGDVAQWHLQFHFDIFDGRPAEYGRQQQRLQWVRRCFQRAFAGAAGKRLHFYNTSLPLVDQYQRLGVAHFHNLPYPINPAFRPQAASCDLETPRPLRVTCGGGFRKEQGKQHLSQGLADVWEGCFASGRMQLLVQAKPSKWSKLGLPVRAVGSTGVNSSTSLSPVVPLPHPLERDEYVELIRQTHIGLLMYDSRRYYARRAGVLCELLCAGVPVIVPAGCWLAEQIAEPGFEYLDQVCTNRGEDSLSLSAAMRAICLSGCPSGPPIAVSVPENAGEMVVSIRLRPSEVVTYLRMSVEQFGTEGQSLAKFSHIVGQRAERKPARAMWRIDPHATSLRLTVQSAYEEAVIPVDDFQVTWLSRGENHPLGCVGLIAADEKHVGKLLLEMADHYPHYRRTAQEFSELWRQHHDPRLTAATLTSSSFAITGEPGQLNRAA